jgi:hypothetical protein
VNNKDEEDRCKIVALLDSTGREKLFKCLPNSEIDRNIRIQLFEHFLKIIKKNDYNKLIGSTRLRGIVHDGKTS